MHTQKDSMNLASDIDHEILPIFLEQIDETLSALDRARSVDAVRRTVKGLETSSAWVGAGSIKRLAETALQRIADANRIDAVVVSAIRDMTEHVVDEARDAARQMGADFHGAAVTLVEGVESRPWWWFWPWFW